jgi:hypothetical protein
MWRLMTRDEEGAFVVLLGLFFLITSGLLAVVADSGLLVNERYQLQNAADAAALAVAIDCVDEDGCPDDPGPILSQYVTENSEHGTPSLQRYDPAAGIVVVGAGRSAVALLSSEGGTASLSTTATATWGAIGATSTAPLAFADCVWQLDRPVVVRVRPSGNPQGAPCGDVSDGEAATLDSDDCRDVPSSAVQASWLPQGSGDSQLNCLQAGTRYPVVIFDEVRPVVAGEQYLVAGYAFFELHHVDAQLCAPQRCLIGEFIVGMTPARPLGGGDFGARTVRLTN